MSPSRVGHVVLVLLAAPLVWRPAHFMIDDAYFYLEVARHVAAGDGSTFNGLTPTNGYHPLWLAACVPLAAVFDGGAALLRAVAVAQVGLAMATLGALLGVVRRVGVEEWGGAAVWMAPVLGLFFFGWGTAGSEAHLNAACLSLGLLALLDARQRGGDRRWAVAGAALGLAVLARLDNVFAVGALGLWAVVSLGRTSPAAGVRAAVVAGAAGAAVLGPYLAWNLAETGHLVPVSGAIKSTFPTPVYNASALSRLGQLVGLGAVGAVALSFVPAAPDRARGPLRALAAGVGLHAGYLLWFTAGASQWPWYYVPGVVLLALAGAVASGALRAATSARTARHAVAGASGLATVFALAVCWAGAFLPGSVHGNFPGRLLRAEARDVPTGIVVGRWLAENTPPDARVLTYDMPGMLSYYSGRAVVPLDGLIADYGYSADLARMGPAAYFDSLGVDYFFAPAPQTGTGGLIWAGGVEAVPGGHVAAIAAPLTRAVAGRFRLDGADLVARRPDPPEYPTALGLWRWRPLPVTP